MQRFKTPKEPDRPHVITTYERELIRQLTPIIQAKKLIRFWYEDKTTSFIDWRTIEPHSIGQVKYKTENVLLTGWFLPTEEQVYNGHTEDWKNYILDGVTKVEILEQNYRLTRAGYNPQDKRMTTIFCCTPVCNW